MANVRSDSHSKLDHVYRVAAIVFGLGLGAFGVFGFVNRLAMFSTTGQTVMGLSTNGALSTISVVVALVLIAAAVVRGGRLASTVLVVVGAAFLLSGLVNTGLLNTRLNLLAFRIPNLIFSFVSGALLLFLGSWGRFTGRLPDDNPYRQERHEHDAVDALPSHFDDPANAAAARELAEAERAVAQHGADPDVTARVEAVRGQRREEDRVKEWRRLRDDA